MGNENNFYKKVQDLESHLFQLKNSAIALKEEDADLSRKLLNILMSTDERPEAVTVFQAERYVYAMHRPAKLEEAERIYKKFNAEHRRVETAYIKNKGNIVEAWNPDLTPLKKINRDITKMRLKTLAYNRALDMN